MPPSASTIRAWTPTLQTQIGAEAHYVAHSLAARLGRVEPQARGDFCLPEPVRAPRGGADLDDVGDVALVVLLVLVSLLFILRSK